MRIGKPTENHTHFDPQSLQQVQTMSHSNGTGASTLANQQQEWAQANVFADDMYPNTTVCAGWAEAACRVCCKLRLT